MIILGKGRKTEQYPQCWYWLPLPRKGILAPHTSLPHQLWIPSSSRAVLTQPSLTRDETHVRGRNAFHVLCFQQRISDLPARQRLLCSASKDNRLDIARFSPLPRESRNRTGIRPYFASRSVGQRQVAQVPPHHSAQRARARMSMSHTSRLSQSAQSVGSWLSRVLLQIPACCTVLRVVVPICPSLKPICTVVRRRNPNTVSVCNVVINIVW